MGLENPLHIAIILVVILLVFGAKRLPEMGKGLGEGMRSFTSGIKGESEPERATKPEQLPAAGEQPATRTSDTEQRTHEPVA